MLFANTQVSPVKLNKRDKRATQTGLTETGRNENLSHDVEYSADHWPSSLLATFPITDNFCEP